MIVIGLTGGIGTGKSEVTSVLAELGASVIDADVVGHEAYRKGTEGHSAVIDRFGPGVVGADGEIDRAALGRLVFGDPKALARLNSLVHPRIREAVREAFPAASGDLLGLLDEDRWRTAEQKVLQALRAYAESTSDGGGLQRRLFAEDALRGLGFVDLSTIQYDVVVMNPPFGDASAPSLEPLDSLLASSGRDIGAAFVRDAAERWCPGGHIGVLLSTAPWFKPVFEQWRADLFFGEQAQLRVCSHVGG